VNTYCIRLFGVSIRIESQDPFALKLLKGNYEAFAVASISEPDLRYSIETEPGGVGFQVVRGPGARLRVADEGQLIYMLEKELTIAIQKRRPELYFLHAACLSLRGCGVLLAAPSGRGKSTLTWGLLHHGFCYLSDELSPVDLRSNQVHPYPHALCLKQEPRGTYSVPKHTLRTSRTLHIPIAPGKLYAQPVSLSCIFFVDFCPELKVPALRRLTAGEAAARLFAQALNPLAHPENGLTAAARIARSVPCFFVRSSDLRSSCRLVKKTVENLSATDWTASESSHYLRAASHR
jgi:hypothetical protein